MTLSAIRTPKFTEQKETEPMKKEEIVQTLNELGNFLIKNAENFQPDVLEKFKSLGRLPFFGDREILVSWK